MTQSRQKRKLQLNLFRPSGCDTRTNASLSQPTHLSKLFSILEADPFPSPHQFCATSLPNLCCADAGINAIMSTFKMGDVLDIGGSQMYTDVVERLEAALKEECLKDSKPTLPDELLYTDVGLPIWNEIIFTPEFYQTHDEIALFDEHGDEIVQRCPSGVTMIDLGAG